MLYAELIRIMNWEMIADPQVGGVMNAEEFLGLCQRAGLPESVAQKMASERALERLRRDLPI